MLPHHFNCRCTFDFAEKHIELQVGVEQHLINICIITPRRLSDVRSAFINHLVKQPYNALDLARICYAQAQMDAPMPWEPGYEEYVLDNIFTNS